MVTLRGCDRPDLLPFEEVRRRLGLMTRLPAGSREVPVAEIVGSVGRVADFDGCFRPGANSYEPPSRSGRRTLA